MAFPHLSQPVAQGVRVLDADPDLGTNLAGERFEQARQELVARTEGIGRGAWRPDVETGPDASGGGGLPILGGGGGPPPSPRDPAGAPPPRPGGPLRPRPGGFRGLPPPFPGVVA